MSPDPKAFAQYVAAQHVRTRRLMRRSLRIKLVLNGITTGRAHGSGFSVTFRFGKRA